MAVEEVDLGADVRDWERLTLDEQHFVKYVLAFFAASDGIVIENLATRFLSEIQIPEVTSLKDRRYLDSTSCHIGSVFLLLSIGH